jgi:pantoate--beta-alanine ligase
MSSRNVRLTNDQRKRAVILFEMLNESNDLLRKGVSISHVREFVKKRLESSPDIKLEYYEVADSENLKLLNNVEESVSPILCIAAFVGEVRLIDNMFYTR